MGRFHRLELPGEDLVLKGLEDLANGVESAESILVQIGAPRLRSLGFDIAQPSYEEFPEARLYAYLSIEDPDTAHERMNALVRRLVSFESTMENLGLSYAIPSKNLK